MNSLTTETDAATVDRSPIETLFDLVPGGRAAIAKRFGVSVQAVAKWQVRVPSENVIGLAEIVEWKVSPHSLRPDLYPHPEDGLPANLRCPFAGPSSDPAQVAP